MNIPALLSQLLGALRARDIEKIKDVLNNQHFNELIAFIESILPTSLANETLTRHRHELYKAIAETLSQHLAASAADLQVWITHKADSEENSDEAALSRVESAIGTHQIVIRIVYKQDAGSYTETAEAFVVNPHDGKAKKFKINRPIQLDYLPNKVREVFVQNAKAEPQMFTIIQHNPNS